MNKTGEAHGLARGLMVRSRWALTLAGVSAAAIGCGNGNDPRAETPTAVLELCTDGETPSADGAALLDRSPQSYRNDCLAGVYENKGLTQGTLGDFYTNTWVSRLEIRDGNALAAIRCTFEGPISNPAGEYEARDVTASVRVPLGVHDWGIEFLESAKDEAEDPYFVSTCSVEIGAERWPFCVAHTNDPEAHDLPEGETFCVYVTGDGDLRSTLRNGTTYSDRLIATKIGD